MRRVFGVSWEELLTKYFACDCRGLIFDFVFKSKLLDLCSKFWEQFGQNDDEGVLVKLSLHRLMSPEVTSGSGD